MLPGTGIEGSSEEKPERAQKLPIKIEGGVMHGGNVLLKRVSELVKEMGAANIGKVTGAVIRLIAWVQHSILDLIHHLCIVLWFMQLDKCTRDIQRHGAYKAAPWTKHCKHELTSRDPTNMTT